MGRRGILAAYITCVPLPYAADLVPPLSQFVKRFGWNQLGIQDKSLYAELQSKQEENPFSGSAEKKRRSELYSYESVLLACRHYFDADSIEEAFWDKAGIPRIVLDGTEDMMIKAGWRKNSGPRPKIGNMSVHLGNRVGAHKDEKFLSIWVEYNK